MFERCLYFNTNALLRRVNKKWEQAYEKTGLSPAHAYLLRLVLDKDQLSQQQIADELQLEKSTITRFVVALEQRGLLTRSRHGREQIVKATAEAKKMKAELNKIGDQLYKSLQQELGEDELVKVVEQIKKINKILS